MKHLRWAVLPFLMLFAACGSDDDGPDLIEFETIAIGDQSPVNPGRAEFVFNDDPEYEQLFGTMADVDFDRETIIAVFLGPIGNGGNSFEITEVIDNFSNITVRVTWQVPRVPSGGNTNHYHIIKTEKLSRPVVFSTLEVRE